MSIEEETSKRFQALLESGALVRSGGTDEEPEYNFDLEVLQEKDPELYQLYMDELDAMLLHLSSEGYLDLDFSEKDIKVSLTDKGEELAEEMIRMGF